MTNPEDSVTTNYAEEHPEQEAHGGSMAPGLVDDIGEPVGDDDTPPVEAPPAEAED